MKKIFLSMIASFIFTLTSFEVNAQFGGILNDLKSAAESALRPQQSAKPETFPGVSSVKEPSSAISNSNSPGQVAQKPPVASREIAFQCKINGKEVVYRNEFDSDDQRISMTFAHINQKRLQLDYDYRTTFKEPLYVHEELGHRFSITTVYFKEKQMTYGISHCQGMMCGNPDQPYSFTIFNGDKKVRQDFCDENTASEFNFPLKIDKNGKLITDLKEVIVIKKTKLKFNPFN